VRLAAGARERILRGLRRRFAAGKTRRVAGAELELYGVDTDPGRLSLARTRMGTSAALSVQSGTALSFADASFDVVIAGNLFFNLASFEAVKDVLGEMKRVCAPGGSLIFDFRNKRNVLCGSNIRWLRCTTARWLDCR
jgi:ubiquinone/menaquinone biosynthesis C-methylase UbiE